ncbi:Transcription initiation factor TFIID subunit 15 [Amphibalanus amphitrite]|uniref:Transcription initiation factor TFIID subunit 15 n=1 Tax=Amphibalanus amphitrite TaxID=1232801 RepID=A0A6A4VW47_AMPAM|nr:Transcription initiation factor TFIID subunit 15 [Amphibalanus amphitrite]
MLSVGPCSGAPVCSGRPLTAARAAAGGYGDDDAGGGGYRQTFEDTIFVSGMPPDSSQEEIADFFGSIGRIKPDKRTGQPRIWMYKDKMTGQNKGECTVTYEDIEAARSAIGWFSGKEFRGNTIKVSMAERRTSTDRSRGGGGGRGGGGFRGRGRGGGGPPGAAGDWKCPNDECSNVNFAWRNECNRCQTPKADGGGGGGGGGFRGGRGGYRGGRDGGPMRSDYGGRDRDRPY